MLLVQCRVFLIPFVLLFGVNAIAIFASVAVGERDEILASQNADRIKNGFEDKLWPGDEAGYRVFLLAGYELFDIIYFFSNPELTFTLFLDHFRTANFSQAERIKILQMIDKLGNDSKMTIDLQIILSKRRVHPDNILELLLQSTHPRELFQQFIKESADEIIMEFLLRDMDDIGIDKDAEDRLRSALLLDLEKPSFFSFLRTSSGSFDETIKNSLELMLRYPKELLMGQALVRHLMNALEMVNFDEELIKNSSRLLCVVERPDEFLIALHKRTVLDRTHIVEALYKAAQKSVLEYAVLKPGMEWWSTDAQAIIDDQCNWTLR